MHHDNLQRLIARGIGNGMERLSAMRWRWDISGDCRSGYSRLLYARPEGGRRGRTIVWRNTIWGRRLRWVEKPGERHVTVAPGSPIPYELEIVTRCRRCDRCRRARSSLWRMRAKQEIALSTRTWFGTATLKPAMQMLYLNRARHVSARQGIDFDALDPDERFRENVRAISPDVTKYLKRVRKNSGAPIRYLWVAERHKSGLPHFHMLVHEMSEALPVRHSVLTEAWWLGFTRFKLIEGTQAAGYVSKYLSKDACARVRASLHYGNPSFDIASKKRVILDPQMPHFVDSILETAQW